MSASFHIRRVLSRLRLSLLTIILTLCLLRKVIELLAESIPGVVIQIAAILATIQEGEESAGVGASWLSLITSGFSAGLISAMISYDYDTDPIKRETSPLLYGYIPAKSRNRMLAFSSMVLFSAGMLYIRCTIVVLLGSIHKRWSFLYIFGDLVLHLLIRFARDDIWHWLSLGSTAMDFLGSIIIRSITKLVMDFSSLVHFRSPLEVGGT
jgi:hypothetical protein